MNRFDFLNTCCAIAAVPAAFEGPKSVAGLNVPDSALSREAAATARACEPIEIFNHSLRAFFFAELIARAKGLAHDVEAVFVASILHDTGLSPAYMSQDRRFEVDSANLAREIAGRHGVERARADAIWDAVSLHDQGEIARWKSTEVMLVNAGVVADFGGSLDLMKRDDVVAVLDRRTAHRLHSSFSRCRRGGCEAKAASDRELLRNRRRISNDSGLPPGELLRRGKDGSVRRVPCAVTARRLAASL